MSTANGASPTNRIIVAGNHVEVEIFSPHGTATMKGTAPVSGVIVEHDALGLVINENDAGLLLFIPWSAIRLVSQQAPPSAP